MNYPTVGVLVWNPRIGLRTEYVPMTSHRRHKDVNFCHPPGDKILLVRIVASTDSVYLRLEAVPQQTLARDVE